MGRWRQRCAAVLWVNLFTEEVLIMNGTLPIRPGRWLLFVAPAAGLFILELLHPDPHARGTVYQSVSPVVDWWLTLHVLLFSLFTLLAFALFVNLNDAQGAVATTARVALGL